MLLLLLMLKVVAAHEAEASYYSRTDMLSMLLLMVLLLACIAGAWASTNSPTDSAQVIRYVIDPPPKKPTLRYHRVEEC